MGRSAATQRQTSSWSGPSNGAACLNGASVSAVVVGSSRIRHGIRNSPWSRRWCCSRVSGDLSRRTPSLAHPRQLPHRRHDPGAALALAGASGPVLAWLMQIPGLKGFLQELHDAPKEALHDKTLLLQTTVLQFGSSCSMPRRWASAWPALSRDGEPHGLFAALVIASLVGDHHDHSERARHVRRDHARHAVPRGRLHDAWRRRGAACSGRSTLMLPLPSGAVAGAPGDEGGGLR